MEIETTWKAIFGGPGIPRATQVDTDAQPRKHTA